MKITPKEEKGMNNTRVASIGDIFKDARTGLYFKVERKCEEMIDLLPVEKTEEDGETVFRQNDNESLAVPEKTFGYFFRLEKEAEEKVPAEGEYSIEDGKLLHGGDRLETGTLVPLEILTGTPGGIVLIVKSRTEGKQDLFLYNLRHDDFTKLADGYDRFSLVDLDRDENMILADNSREVEIPSETDGEPAIRETAVTQTVFVFDGAYELFVETGLPLGKPFSFPGLCDKGDVVLFINDRGYREVNTVGGETVTVVDPDRTGERTYVSRFIVDRENPYDYEGIEHDKCSFAGVAKAFVPTHDEEGNFLVITEEGIVHTNFGHGIRVAKGQEVLDAVREYPIPLGLGFGGRTETVFVLGNEQYEVARIRVVKTRDRGYVTTVEKG